MTPQDLSSRTTGLVSSDAATVRAVLARSSEDPIAPCLFYQEGVDWRWISWEALAGRTLETAEGLGARSLVDVEVGYPSAPTREALVVDLALQHVGAIPRPTPPTEAEGWRSAGRPWVAGETEAASGALEGASTTELGGRSVSWRRARQREVEALGARCRSPLPPARAGLAGWFRRPRDREVVVDVLELERPLCRAGVSWTLERGGALVLAHERSSLEASARWARPTRLWAETLDGRFERLARAVLEGSGRRPRVLSALWCGPERPSPELCGDLEAAGVEIAEWRGDADAGASGPVDTVTEPG